MRLRNKKVLITAGPTWVKIDSVRVISNTASAETGMLLAKAFSKLGSKVTLLSGPVNTSLPGGNIKVRNFKFFDELSSMVKGELKRSSYDIVVHSAAVSDYMPCHPLSQKIESGLKGLSIKLKPTLKIINFFKSMQPEIFLVGFKYEPEAKKDYLYQEAVNLIKQSHADLVVSNTTRKGRYLAILVSPDKVSKVFKNKASLAEGIIKVIKDYNA